MVKLPKKGLLLFILCLCLLPFTALGDEARVFDRCNLFTASEAREIEAVIQSMQEKYNMDFVVLTDDQARYSDDDDDAERYSTAYADDFYDYNGFGVGEEADGFLYFIDMSNRMPTISTTGAMIDYVTDDRLENLLYYATSDLRQSDYAGSALNMLSRLQKYLDEGIPEGQYRYDVVTGQQLTPRHKMLTSNEILISLVVAIIGAVIWVISVYSSYRLKGGTYKYDMASNSTLLLTGKEDTYLTTTVSKTRRPEPSNNGGSGGGGGSGTHSSSSGGSHGGGSGGRF